MLKRDIQKGVVTVDPGKNNLRVLGYVFSAGIRMDKGVAVFGGILWNFG
ncbi:MAG: hypothetical protein HGB05_09470 [Chloroflexi bacterium]|nr:hypothetical protein [Chloroflexota bacterium]